MTLRLRSVRVRDGLWLKVSEKASQEGTTVSALIRKWMQDYLETDDDD